MIAYDISQSRTLQGCVASTVSTGMNRMGFPFHYNANWEKVTKETLVELNV